MLSFLKHGKILGDTEGEPKASNSKSARLSSLPWVEKYRPKKISDVVEQNEVIQVLEQCLSGADLPNLLFYGPPGTGKTSTILAAAHQLFGAYYADRILDLNASDERGIDIIREKVMKFTSLATSGTRPDGKPCPAFKIVILDEADCMTHAAQAALRRLMETESRSTRFCLLCNYVSRIIEPLTSRCTKFRFKPLNESMIFERLRFICTEEDVTCDDDTLNTLIEISSGGDMRRAINCLQSCARLKGKGVPLNSEIVLEVTGFVPKKWLQGFIDASKTENYQTLQEFITTLQFEAYAATQFLEQFNELLVMTDQFNHKQKALIGEKMAIVSHRLLDGGSEYIQLFDLGCTVISSWKLS